MDTIDERRIVIQPLPGFCNGRVDMLRLDLIHPVISGNKWFKLKHNLAQALSQGCRGVLSFGGAYSNHLIAMAAAAHAAGLHSVGIVRGMEPARLTPTLEACRNLGMTLIPVSREEYDSKDKTSPLPARTEAYPGYFIIPEGGANEAGRAGAAAIAGLIPLGYDTIVLSVGTGTTFAGIRGVLPLQQYMLGFAPMKGGRYLRDEIRSFLPCIPEESWNLYDEFHFGGFGRWTPGLAAFMNRCYAQWGIALDMVYTAKMMYGLEQLHQRQQLPAQSRILCIHTGGLQGNVSMGGALQF